MSSAGTTNPMLSGLRIYFWSFGEFGMLLGSKAPIFSRSDSNIDTAGSGFVITPRTPPYTNSTPQGHRACNFDLLRWYFCSLGWQELSHRPSGFTTQGFGWGCEPWQKALAYVGMGEMRAKKREKSAKETNQLLQGSLPDLIPILLFPRRKVLAGRAGRKDFLPPHPQTIPLSRHRFQ